MNQVETVWIGWFFSIFFIKYKTADRVYIYMKQILVYIFVLDCDTDFKFLYYIAAAMTKM